MPTVPQILRIRSRRSDSPRTRFRVLVGFFAGCLALFSLCLTLVAFSNPVVHPLITGLPSLEEIPPCRITCRVFQVLPASTIAVAIILSLSWKIQPRQIGDT
jgi:ABC-type Fe3+-siderophore transport system permease subunit